MTDWLVIQQDDSYIVRVRRAHGAYAIQTFTSNDGQYPSATVLLTDDAIDQLADYAELCRAEEAEEKAGSSATGDGFRRLGEQVRADLASDGESSPGLSRADELRAWAKEKQIPTRTIST